MPEFSKTRQKVALITGASRGLGRASAARLAQAGYVVWLGVRNEAEVVDFVAEIEASGGQARSITLDVTVPETIERCASLIESEHGFLDLLVNNAGIMLDMLDRSWQGNTATTIDPTSLRRTFEVNLFGVVAVTQAMWPLLVKASHANVVNVSSHLGSNTLHADPESRLAGRKPFAYAASKAALNTFTTHLADAGRSIGIQVNSAHPGWVRTALGTEDATMSTEEGVETILDLALLPPNSRTGCFEHCGCALPW
ncbi:MULTISPECIES: SDR family NAD(P)-dependent oxidoreductase [Pseudomonadota]|uniref:SDR family NAD(P)-dependent oxidoreductase n=1 Tax=Pseudomonadota TaxID=1224 RepID=UPI0009A38EB7|nr:SDR family NAD(P)-dependent oxidoreductase [Pseudomonas aeruginosa]